MALDLEEIRSIARLAHLELTADEERLFADQLGEVVASFDILGSFETAAPAGAGGPALPEADDVPAPCLPREVFLANAPAASEGFLVVPRVAVRGPRRPPR